MDSKKRLKQTSKEAKIRKILLIAIGIFGVLIVGWFVGIRFVHENDCRSSSLSPQQTVEIKKCEEEAKKSGDKLAELKCKVLYSQAPLEYTGCDYSLYDYSVFVLLGVEVALIVTLLVKGQKNNTKGRYKK